MYRSLFKPLLDRIIAFIGLIILSPVILTVSLLLWFIQGGKPFFAQLRPGYREHIFRLIKFRTMNNERGDDGALLPDAERLTPIGRFVRKSSLDEIPQLINVLKGDMSIVGPRPLLIEYLPLYNDFQKRRHEVKPGITGWAQVNGRNNISWQKRFELDVYYVDNQSFMIDVKILLKTIKNVVAAKNVNQQGEATVQYFRGNEIS